DLYGYLELELGMTSPQIVLDKVLNFEYGDVENLIVDLYEKIPVNSFMDNDSIFEFRPNSTLTGGKYPCRDLHCRITRIEELMRFSSLYANKIYIVSPIDKYIKPLKDSPEIDTYELAVDIIILLELKPLAI